MALLSKTGTFQTGTGAAATTVAVTGVGFVPQVIILWWGGRLATGGAAGNIRRGFGFAVSTSSRQVIASASDDAQAAAVSRAAGRSDGVVLVINSSTGADAGRLDLQSFDADGFTLVVSTQFGSSYSVSYMALGGGDIVAATEVISSPAGTGVQNYTGIGFAPTCVIFAAANQTSAPPSQQADSDFMVGWASAVGSEGVLFDGSDNAAATMAAKHYLYNGQSVAAPDAAKTFVDRRAAYNGTVAGGYSLNWVETNANERIHVLALSGVTAKVTSLLTLIAIGPIVVTGVGFTPKAALFAASAYPIDTNDVIGTDDYSILGGADGTNQSVHYCEDRDGLATSTIRISHRTTLVYDWTPTSYGVTPGQMSLTTFDTDGLTCQMSAADPGVASFVSILCLGSIAGPPGPNALMLVGVGQ